MGGIERKDYKFLKRDYLLRNMVENKNNMGGADMAHGENVNDFGLVSIIMLSKNHAQYVGESVRSVIAQTYTNWELLFLDDNSKDNSITLMMDLKDEARIKNEDGIVADRIKVSKTVSDRGSVINRNSSLKESRGRWIAFLNVGDVWAPDKLERQIRFMKENGYAFSYHQYRLMDSDSKDRGFLISGKTRVTHSDMVKCCWPGYLTVMYDAAKIGKVKERSSWTNDYALWLCISDKTDLYLLPESLATIRTKWNKLGNILLTNNTKWRYDAYRMEEDLGRFTSFFYTIRNGWYGIVKWLNYVKKDNK